MEQALAPTAEAPATGLRANILSPIETLAQSISTIAPTTTPTMTIPLVFVLAGNGTWLAYLFATAAILLIALCISRFARYTSCSGSLYTYATSGLPPAIRRHRRLGTPPRLHRHRSIRRRRLHQLRQRLPHPHSSASPRQPHSSRLLCVAVSTFIAYRDVQVSARLMLWIEATSVASIAIVIALCSGTTACTSTTPNYTCTGVTPSAVRLGVVLALFSFVGFESATTLGARSHQSSPHHPPRRHSDRHLHRPLLHSLRLPRNPRHAAAHQDLGESTAPLASSPPSPASPSSARSSTSALSSACSPAPSPASPPLPESSCAWPTTASPTAASAPPTTKTPPPPPPSSSPASSPRSPPASSHAAESPAPTSTAGWAPSPSTDSSPPTASPPSRSPSTSSATTPLTNGSLAALRRRHPRDCSSPWPAPSTPYPTAPYNWLPYVYLAYILCGVAWFAISRRNRPQPV